MKQKYLLTVLVVIAVAGSTQTPEGVANAWRVTVGEQLRGMVTQADGVNAHQQSGSTSSTMVDRSRLQKERFIHTVDATTHDLDGSGVPPMISGRMSTGGGNRSTRLAKAIDLVTVWSTSQARPERETGPGPAPTATTYTKNHLNARIALALAHFMEQRRYRALIRWSRN